MAFERPPKGAGLFPVFRVFARAGENGGLKDLIRMTQIDDAEEYQRRWLETANTVVGIEAAPLREGDDIVLKGRRIVALEALIGKRASLDDADRAFLRDNDYHARLSVGLPVLEDTVERLFDSIERNEAELGPWVAYRRSFYIPIQSVSPSQVWEKCGVDLPD